MPSGTIIQSERLRGLLVTLAMLAVLGLAVLIAAWFVNQRHQGEDIQVGPFTLQVPPRWQQQAFHTDSGVHAHVLQDPHHRERQMLIALMADPATPTLAAALEDAVDHFAFGSGRNTQWQEQPPQTLGSSLPARWCIGYSERRGIVHTLGVIEGPDRRYLVITLTTPGDEQQHEMDIQLLRAIAGSVRCEQATRRNERQLVDPRSSNPNAPRFVTMAQPWDAARPPINDLLRNN